MYISMQSKKISCTPDSISAFFLKKVAPYILDVITYLFNLSIKSGTLTDQWKRAIVVPIFKRGLRDLPCNYRLISLTCVLCHILEKILCKKLSSYLLENNLLSGIQFGFMPGKSSCSQLLVVLHTWLKNVDVKLDLDVIYTDFAKAFDTISHLKFDCSFTIVWSTV